ncbi:MAG: Uma2 family endonuclease [Thermoguttaceae bacterium]|jgi:Uma2 family endonuclease
MATIQHVTTAEQLFAAGDIGRCELVRGELIMMSPAGSEHGWIVTNITAPLAVFVKQNSLGRVFGAETGFRIGHDPDTVRAPDVAFVTAERIGGKLAAGFFPGPPDLAVEVLSPDDRAGEVLAKVQDWLDAGCRAVWVVDPRTSTVTVYRSRSEIAVLGTSEALSGGDLLPNFSLPVSELFQG